MQQKRKAAANVFMEQNVAQQAEGADDEAARIPPAAPATPGAPFGGAPPPPQRKRSGGAPVPPDGLKTSEELQLEKEPVRVRETGFWPFKRVIVPPNVYVVHTRIGRKAPVTIGLGLSFSYNPNTDAYLIVPAAMQTIGIVANGISREKQGINILAYVQWQINDFAVAYRKLDFSDSRDPLGIVNAQLREQAEAAIKDKIATLSVEDVLTDKQPIIEELTARLKAVAEGRGGQADDEGLGIKIVTVQLKEALVSSQRLWDNLQAPFRYNQEKAARISFLLAQDEIRQKELQNRQTAETSEAEALVEIERLKQTKQTEALELRLAQEQIRFTAEQETTRQKLQLEEQTTRARRESQQRLALEAARAEQETTLAALRRAQEEAVEQTRLDAEASARQKTLQVEQALQELAEAAPGRAAAARTRDDTEAPGVGVPTAGAGTRNAVPGTRAGGRPGAQPGRCAGAPGAGGGRQPGQDGAGRARGRDRAAAAGGAQPDQRAGSFEPADRAAARTGRAYARDPRTKCAPEQLRRWGLRLAGPVSGQDGGAR